MFKFTIISSEISEIFYLSEIVDLNILAFLYFWWKILYTAIVLSRMSLLMERLASIDERLSKEAYLNAHRNKVVKLTAEIFSFSSDELLWFGLPSLLGCSIFTIRWYFLSKNMGCIEEAAWDCFGSSAIGTFAESIAKLACRRIRPSYAKQAENYSIHGEWFSFPSGHAMRAFYWIFYLTKSEFLELLKPVIVFPGAVYLIPWAIVVAWSRVAKGRHYYGDVICGGLFGSALGFMVEAVFTRKQRAVAKTIAGFYTVLCWGFYAVIPFVTGAKGSVRSKIVVGILFYAYAVNLLFATIPRDSEVAGAQTLVEATNTSSYSSAKICRQLW